MIISDGHGYQITYDAPHNMITIVLPQTQKTVTNTYEIGFDGLSKRRVIISDSELSMVLQLVRYIFEFNVKKGDINSTPN